MRVYIIGNDGITLCREPPAAVNEGEIEARNIPSPPRGGSSERVSTGEEVGFSLGGTDGSNPSPSSGESCTNLTSVSSESAVTSTVHSSLRSKQQGQQLTVRAFKDYDGGGFVG